LGDRLSAWREQLLEAQEERLHHFRQLQERAGQVTAIAQAGDGLITVKVGPHGELLALDLDPGVYEHLSPQRLAAALTELAAAAAADAAAQVQEIMALAFASEEPE
jgi:DNA-binding protein YbaB